jgi:protein gp37
MAETTGISWTDSTFNPWRGCTKVSPGCTNCYAETLSHRNPSVLGEWGDKGTRVVAAESYWRQPLKWERDAAYDLERQNAGARRTRVFCASLADVFEDRPDLQLPRARLFGLIEQTPHLDWLLLTKRPENIEPILMEIQANGGKYEPDPWALAGAWIIDGNPPANVWLGVSVEDQQYADERIPLLLRLPAAVHFLSVEPLLGRVDLTIPVPEMNVEAFPCDTHDLDWVIVGGESGANAKPMHRQWARDLRDQCVTAGVPFFFKQWGEWAPGDESFDQRLGVAKIHAANQESAVRFVAADGSEFGTNEPMFRVGKTAAGDLLDGVQWHQFPEVR